MLNNLLLQYTRRFPFDKGKELLLPFIKLPDGPVEYTNRYGAKFLIDPTEYQMKQIYYYDLYEKNTVRHLVRLVKPEFTFLDVGTNIGFYALTFSRLLNEGMVHCFEPNQISYERLQKNVALNSTTNIVLNKIGLSDKAGEVELSYNLSNTGTASIFKRYASNQHTETIALMKMDDYCKSKQIKQVDFIKVDIEGGELPFLMGAEETIRKSPKMILVAEMMEENFAAAGYTSEYLFNYIRSLAFEAYLPKSFPFGLKKITALPKNYADNVVFLKGY